MKMKEWKERLEECKKTQKLTGYDYDPNVKRTNGKLILTEIKKCSRCGAKANYVVRADFKKQPERITIFQAGILFSIFALREIPRDYANYHNCEAGKEFIRNLKDVQVDEIVTKNH